MSNPAHSFGLTDRLVAATVSGVAAAALLCASATTARAQTITYEHTTKPFPGVRLYERHTSGPNERIWAAYISLCHADVSIDARSSQASRITAPTWGSAMGASLAVNGDFWRTDTSTPIVYGDAVGVGMRWPASRTGLGSQYAGEWYHQHYGWIAFGDGWVEINHTGYVKKHAADLGVTLGVSPTTFTTKIPAGTHALVSGFPELMVEGQRITSFPDRGDMADRNPRTAMGLSKDRQTFMLVVVDGRTTSSVGMTGTELSALMKDLGAYEAFNLDGGGSSQMWLKGQGVVDRPSDGTPRPVSNLWGVFTGANAGQAPGSCFTPGGCYATALPEAAGSRFGDLPDDADGQPAAALVVDQGLLPACATGDREMFCPACSLTRRDAAAMVARGAGLDTSAPPATASFSDVAVGDDDFAEIEAAQAAGIVTGCGDGTFCPDEPVTRGDLAAWTAKARGEDSLDAACAPSGDASAAMPRSEGATLAAAAFNLDGQKTCGDVSGGDGTGGSGGGDASIGGGRMGGGCAASPGAGGTSAALVLLTGLLLIAARRRRSGQP